VDHDAGARRCGRDVLSRLAAHVVSPDRGDHRIAAEAALQHPYFADVTPN